MGILDRFRGYKTETFQCAGVCGSNVVEEGDRYESAAPFKCVEVGGINSAIHRVRWVSVSHFPNGKLKEVQCDSIGEGGRTCNCVGVNLCMAGITCEVRANLLAACPHANDKKVE